MKRWLAIIFLACAWLRDGIAAHALRERAKAAEQRAAEAEAWAATVEEEAGMIVADRLRR